MSSSCGEERDEKRKQEKSCVCEKSVNPGGLAVEYCRLGTCMDVELREAEGWQGGSCNHLGEFSNVML